MTFSEPPLRPTLAIAQALLWLRPDGIANVADGSQRQSREIAASFVELVHRRAAVMGVDQAGQTSGTRFEDAIRDLLRVEVPRLMPTVHWLIERGQPIYRFRQYRHLDDVAQLVNADESGLLRDALGTEYLVIPDVTVGRTDRGIDLVEVPYLHASISCKWTIRSDRVQNARHEANVLIRHRRGRSPHIAVVTAEPLPSRLASIAQGTGEIDRTYHLALPELQEAVENVGNTQQRKALRELIANDRLADLSDLSEAMVR